MVDLSVIIVSFNTKEITAQCIESLLKALGKTPEISAEIIVVDNNSEDGSTEVIKQYPVVPINLNANIGFGGANNKALAVARGKYTLFLNSDVLHNDINYGDILHYLDVHREVGALTVKVVLDETRIDPASHRGFPTLWRSFTYFSKLEQTFGGVPGLRKLVGGYHLLDKDLNTVHEIESPSGAFFLSPTALLKELGGFDRDFFMYGEDLDLAFRIVEKGYKIIYYPKYTVTHLKYSSGIKKKDAVISKKIKHHFFDAMRIFYDKHYAKAHPPFIRSLVYWAIRQKMARV